MRSSQAPSNNATAQGLKRHKVQARAGYDVLVGTVKFLDDVSPDFSSNSLSAIFSKLQNSAILWVSVFSFIVCQMIFGLSAAAIFSLIADV